MSACIRSTLLVLFAQKHVAENDLIIISLLVIRVMRKDSNKLFHAEISHLTYGLYVV